MIEPSGNIIHVELLLKHWTLLHSCVKVCEVIKLPSVVVNRVGQGIGAELLYKFNPCSNPNPSFSQN